MLIECPECGRRTVSDEAARCPRCGIAKPGGIFWANWANRRRPYERVVKSIGNARKLWVKFVALPCTCRRYSGVGNDVVGHPVNAKLVESSQPAVHQYEDSDGSYYYRWKGSEPEYYIEFTVECEVCKKGWVGTLSYGKWSYNLCSDHCLLVSDGPKRPKPDAPYFVYSIKLLLWEYEYDWSQKKTWVWRELTLSEPY